MSPDIKRKYLLFFNNKNHRYIGNCISNIMLSYLNILYICMQSPLVKYV